MTYELAFRERVLATRAKQNLSIEATAKLFGIGKASIMRWLKQLTPQRNRNKGATKLDMEALKQDIALYPDAYQYERAQRLGMSQVGIWHALKRLKVTFKKNPSASQSGSRQAIYLLPKDSSR
jgi:transposase